MSNQALSAELRTEFGKGAARRIRRADKIPAVIYGHGTDPSHIILPGHETLLALRTANALLTLDVEGTSQLALVKQVQRDPIKGTIEHVDLIVVRRGEKVVVDVVVSLVGDAASETVVVLDAQTVSLEVEATNIPESVEVSIEGLEAGTQILAKDLQLPEGAAIHGDEDLLVVNITHEISEEALESDLAESPAGGEGAAPGGQSAEAAPGQG